MELELTKAEVFMLLKAVEEILENFDDDDDEGIRQAITVKEKLKQAFEELSGVD